MPLVRYDGPGHVLEAFDQTVNRGSETVFTDQEYRSLEAQPHLRLTIVTPDSEQALERPSVHGSRRQWQAYAEQQEVEVTEAMTRDDIVAAVDLSAAQTDDTKETP